MPTFEPAGQPAGLVANCASPHAFCNVVRREGRVSGSMTSTLWRLASPGLWAIFTSNEAPMALLVFPCVETLKDGLNGRFAQLAAWKGLETPALAPAVEVIVAPTPIALQFVGLNMNPDRLVVTLTVRRSSGMPCRMVGTAYGPDGSVVTVICAVCGSMLIAARTMTLPRSNGPARAWVTIDRPKGAPLD